MMVFGVSSLGRNFTPIIFACTFTLLGQVDSSGNAFVTGNSFNGLDGNSNAGDDDVFVMKYSSTGTWQWTCQFGSSSREFPRGIEALGGQI